MRRLTIDQFDYNDRDGLLFNPLPERDPNGNGWEVLPPSAVYSTVAGLIAERDRLLKRLEQSAEWDAAHRG